MASYTPESQICPRADRCYDVLPPYSPRPNFTCAAMDDQVAYVPAQLAPFYFKNDPGCNRGWCPSDGVGLSEAAMPGSVMSTDNGACAWPEGQLTCRLLRAGIKLEVLGFTATLPRYWRGMRAQMWSLNCICSPPATQCLDQTGYCRTLQI
eukprot:TRINITY_DN8700_c0_g1_i22.p1 TRINITY_DN8700_c0_g1~~TRINITY_DN8700_c0_g1_i22.p1  ORF type:complete len:151 (+),score=14.37 TRINITY_DN8700_c0_g1_i22:246-698(+)